MSDEGSVRTNDKGERRKQALIAAGIVGTWEHDHVRDVVQHCAIGAKLLAGDASLAWCDLDPVQAMAGVYTDDVAASRTLKRRATAEPDVLVEEHRLRSAQGEVRRVLRHGRTYRDADGRPTVTTGVVIDITAIEANGSSQSVSDDLSKAAEHGVAAYDAIQASGIAELLAPARALLMAIGREIARGMSRGDGQSH